jgi:hypothetical protein
MSNEMIERVKMVIKNSYLEWWKPELHHALLPDHIVDQLARAAIEAMRVPTEAMLTAGEDECDQESWVPDIYNAMITAALGEDQ